MTGKDHKFVIVLHDVLLRKARAVPVYSPCCLGDYYEYESSWTTCRICKSDGVDFDCEKCRNYEICKSCYKAKQTQTIQNALDVTKNETYLQCPASTFLSLQVPSDVVLGNAELREKLRTAVKNVLDLESKGNIEVGRMSEIVVDRIIQDRDKISQQNQMNISSKVSEHASIISSSQTNCRTLLIKDSIMKEHVQKEVQVIRSTGLFETYESNLHQENFDIKSALMTGTRSDVCFTALMEFSIPNLPLVGQRAALLRFAPPPLKLGRDTKRQEASVYVQHGGILAGATVVESALTENDTPVVKPDYWHVLVAIVDSISGVLTLYLDGNFVYKSTPSLPTRQPSQDFKNNSLSFGSRLIVFGGGNRSEARGGKVRRIRLIDGALTNKEVTIEATKIQSQNPLFNKSATVIQSLTRGMLTRALRSSSEESNNEDSASNASSDD
mmetsp:Transcript_29497/g.35928  ORF Transcript_29497/g.35928 Transcript_29497/m.35928 type:complete len:441 (-) Transcript_29497:211-1533(-)